MHDWHEHSGEIPYETYLRDQFFFNGMNIKEKLLVHIALIGLFSSKGDLERCIFPRAYSKPNSFDIPIHTKKYSNWYNEWTIKN